ncbi:MAG: hypothetical protein J6T71_05380 [Paludibacteraceae bacterium]|nr:hypothetical protein [Paludibacteraceae bacterium]
MKDTMRNNTMKRNTLSILLIALLALGAMQASAVDYQTKYKGTMYNVQSTASYGAAVPATTFQSTSAYASSEWAENPMLNSDGTINEGAYMGGRNNAPGGPRRIVNPDDEDEDDKENGTPLGDALIPLFFLAIAYGGWRFLRRRKEA